MLYIKSRRLGQSTAIGLLSITVLILAQGLFGAWKMEQLTNEVSESLVLFSDTQVEALTLKSMLINLRKLEKDILLFSHSPSELKRVDKRWRKALSATRLQFTTMEQELIESDVTQNESISALENAFHSYSKGVSNVAKNMLKKEYADQFEARTAMAVYKKHIYDMESQIDSIVDSAEELEINTLEHLAQAKLRLFWTLGLFGFVSIFISVSLSIWIVRKNLSISRTLEYQALHDTLTSILNRRGLAVAMQHNVTGGVMSYVDLDRFKLVNDLCGHSIGDELLINLTKKMNILCTEESCTLARVGGDEFVIWLNDINGLERAQQIANKLVALIEAHPFEWMGQSMSLGASVGLAVGKTDFLLTELLSRADAACRIAKIPGNAKVIVYEESDPTLMKISREKRWAAKIPQMLIENNFILYAQSIVPLNSSETRAHVEILIRGVDEDGSIIPPGVFLPAAERFGLMPKIDRWVLETLLTGNFSNDIIYSVNMSAHTLADKAYLPHLINLVNESGRAQQLIFEITESAVMSSVSTAQEYISNLKALGCRFSLDDFGSGFSSFAYLRDLEVDYLKIDGSLISILGHKASDAALVQAIVNMADSLGLNTIAEYVETHEIAVLLTEMGVGYGQGYGLHKPEPLSTFNASASVKFCPKTPAKT